MAGRDFVYRLILKQDKQSFEQGSRSLDKVSNNISRMIGVAANAAIAIKGLAIATGIAEGKEAILAESLGISTQRLDQFKAAARIAGVSGKTLTDAMVTLNRSMTDLELKGSNSNLNKSLGILSSLSGTDLNPTLLKTMDAASRMEKILSAAQSIKDKNKAASVLKDIIGAEGEQLFWALNSRNMTIEQALAEANKKILTDEESKKKALDFSTELNKTAVSLQQVGALFGAEVGGNLTDFLKELNTWFDAHGDDISKKIQDFSKSLSTIATALKPFASATLKIASSLILDLTDSLAKILTGDIDGATESFKKFLNTIKEELEKLWDINPDKMKEAASAAAEDAKNQGKNWFQQKWEAGGAAISTSEVLKAASKPGEIVIDGIKYIIKTPVSEGLPMQDGIMRPDGRVTQVAPDDWVFAARDVGALASAFVPQQTAYQGGSVTINQNLTVSGDYPMATKRAAYDGANEAIRAIDNAAMRRMLMPGTR